MNFDTIRFRTFIKGFFAIVIWTFYYRRLQEGFKTRRLKRLPVRLALCFVIFGNAYTFGQINPSFAWMKGSNTFNPIGIYGTQGVAGPTMVPGGRENAMSWVDANGQCWLFGGQGYTSTNTQTYLNDLWKYDISANQWTWMSGSNTGNSHGNYGTKNVPSASNLPGARQNAYTWTDQQGNLWLFGGYGFAAAGALSYLNDLWKYDVVTNVWTWVGGSSTSNALAVYGSIGTPSVSNIPGARFGGNAWKDASGNLWLFGGQENHGAIERLNDLWRYNISTQEWCWMKGANITNQNGTYGTKGMAAMGNTPGSRQASVAWTDNANQFWIFGGYGFPETGTSYSYLNDLWKYDVATNQWTWMSGSNQTNQTGSYGTKGVSAPTNIPGARQLAVGWYGSDGNLWLFGSWGYTGPLFGRLNDLWQYHVATDRWIWYGGSNGVDQAGVYGTQGVSSTNNIPGSRRMAVSFKANNGDMFLWGGSGYDHLDSLGLMNDLWKIAANSLVRVSEVYQEEEAMTIFPTLCNDELFISFQTEKNHEVKVVDGLGRVIYTTFIHHAGKLDISGWTAGLYYLINGENLNHPLRFIKQ